MHRAVAGSRDHRAGDDHGVVPGVTRRQPSRPHRRRPDRPGRGHVGRRQGGSFNRLKGGLKPFQTAHALTGSGGEHYLFRIAPDLAVKTVGGWLAGINLKGEHGAIVVEPSVPPAARTVSPKVVAAARHRHRPCWLSVREAAGTGSGRPTAGRTPPALSPAFPSPRRRNGTMTAVGRLSAGPGLRPARPLRSPRGEPGIRTGGRGRPQPRPGGDAGAEGGHPAGLMPPTPLSGGVAVGTARASVGASVIDGLKLAIPRPTSVGGQDAAGEAGRPLGVRDDRPAARGRRGTGFPPEVQGPRQAA